MSLESIRGWRSLAVAVLVGAIGLFAWRAAQADDPPVVDDARELVIVHPSVVDPFLNGGRSHNGGPEATGGPWSLRFLLHAMVSNRSEAHQQAFYRSLFEQWLSARTATNGVVIPARDQSLIQQRLLDQFSTVDGAGVRTFQMWKAPFELMAIVYRPDLRASNGSNGGELRFAYKLVGPSGEDLKFTLNLEYRVRTQFWFTFSSQSWAHNFHALGALELGSEAYLARLETLAKWHTTFTGASAPQLAQIRTNEAAFSPTEVWEMRELVKVNTSSGVAPYVAAVSVKNTPAASFNGTTTLADFITASSALASTDTSFMSFNMPETLGGATFLGAASLPGTTWTVPSGSGADPVAVDNFGLLTCNGCHHDNKRAGDMGFYHISPEVSPGLDGRSRLSLFLTTPDPDPQKVGRRPGELNRRRADLEQLLAQPWTPEWIQ